MVRGRGRRRHSNSSTQALLMNRNPEKIVVFGQYKTGTTGFFTRIRNSLPESTRTLFESNEYIQEDQDKSRWVLAKVILKEPGHPDPVNYASFQVFDRRICITRDPRDWLVSATLFNCQLKESVFGNEEAMEWVMDYLHQKEASPHSLPLKMLLEYILGLPPALDIDTFGRRASARHAFCTEFQNNLKDNVLGVRYEDFVDGRVHEMEEYLNLPLDGPAEVAPDHAHVPRTCSYGNWKDWFTEEDVIFFRPFFEEYIQHHGYDTNWLLSNCPIINPAHCSQYVTKVVKIRKSKVGAERAVPA